MEIVKPKEYIREFEEMGFGVFVHFGLYSQLEKGEWVANLHHIEKDEYKKLAKTFEVDDLEGMVRDIKKSGAKYITFTTRHHDGFSLYDTCGLNDFDAPHSAAGRDLVKEFVDACRKHDIIPFFYHTTMEWFNDDFDNNFEKYLEYLRESVKILCTNYGKIGGLWFDGNWSKEGDIWQEDKLYSLIRQYQPDAMIINNTGLDAQGKSSKYDEIDCVTFERGSACPLKREGMKKYLAAEVCDSVNMHWGIAEDWNYKSPKEIIEALCRSRAAGANYLINIGPDRKGNVPALSMATLDILGQWMNYFGDSIYNVKPCYFKEDEKNAIVKDDKHIYIFVHDLKCKGSENVTVGNGQEELYSFNGFDIPIHNLRWMDNDETISFRQDNNGLSAYFDGYEYGTDYCVRVAIGDID